MLLSQVLVKSRATSMWLELSVPQMERGLELLRLRVAEMRQMLKPLGLVIPMLQVSSVVEEEITE